MRTLTLWQKASARIDSVSGTPPGGTGKTYASYVLYASQGGISQINLGNSLLEVRRANRQQFRDALATIKAAAGKLEEGSDERNKLQAVLDKYGDEGEKNKVFIKFGAAGGFPADESTSLFGGKSTITFDMKMINNMFKTNESINPDYKASTGRDCRSRGCSHA